MNPTGRSYCEKRDFIRMNVDTPVLITLSDGGQLQGTCHNLSGGGLLVSMLEQVPLGTYLSIAVSSSYGHQPMLKARAMVTRLHQQTDTEHRPCYIGLKIDSVLE